MVELLTIEEPDLAARARPQWAAFLELGFRPLYVMGCLWAVTSVALWVFAPGLLHGRLTGVFWHAHEMLWGFVATIAVGFLLTAGSNWTGINPLRGRALGALTALWLLARLAYLLPGDAAFVLRPHAAAATAKAAADAMSLAAALVDAPRNPDAALRVWETRQLEYGRRLAEHGVALGRRSVERHDDTRRLAPTLWDAAERFSGIAQLPRRE